MYYLQSINIKGFKNILIN